MGQINKEYAERIKDRVWSTDLKDFYTPEDFVRYFKEVRRLKSSIYSDTIKIKPPEDFFHKLTIEKGYSLLKQEKLSSLESQLEWLKNKKIPSLEEEIKRLEE